MYYADQPARLETPDDLAGVLLVASRTPALEADVKALGLVWQDLGDGYWKLCGGPFALYVAEIDVVAEAEDDDLFRAQCFRQRALKRAIAYKGTYPHSNIRSMFTTIGSSRLPYGHDHSETGC